MKKAVQTRVDATVEVELLAVLMVGIVGAGLAMTSPAAPTGSAIWDSVLKALVALMVVLAASKSPRWAVIVMAAVAAAFGGAGAWAWFGWLALLLGVGTSALSRRSRLAGAAVGGLAVQTLLRLPAIGFFGLPSIIAGCAFLLVGYSGYRFASKRNRRQTRIGLAMLAATTTAILIVGAASMLNARGDVNQGIAAAQRSVQLARAGDASAAAAQLERAEAALSAANRQVTGLTASTLRLVPIVAQHQRAIEGATAVGADVARSASAVVTDIDRAGVSLDAGSVDLAVLEAMSPRLAATSASLADAVAQLDAVDSPWLLSALSQRIEGLSDDVEVLLPEVELAAEAMAVLPGMLGVDGPQHYLVFFGTPAESREFGGFVGSWALVSFNGGDVELVDSGRKRELYSISRSSIVAPGSAPDWYLDMARPTEFPENLTSSPNFELVADISRQVLGGVSDQPLAGLIYMDAWALIDLLQLTGPVETPLQDDPLTVDNAEQFFFRDQYEFEGSERTEVFDTLSDVSETVLSRMMTTALPGPEELGRILGPAARAGHLQIVTFDERHNDFLRSVKLLRDFGRDETSDFVGLVQTNGLANKMDLYLQRTLDYRGEIDEGGVLRATATATLRSVVPPDAPEFALGSGPDRANNKVLLSLYTPHLLTSLTVNGVDSEFRATDEFGLVRYLVEVVVPPTGEALVVEFGLEGELAAEPYSLEIWHQPLVNTDQVTVSVGAGSGRSIEWTGQLVENEILEMASGES